MKNLQSMLSLSALARRLDLPFPRIAAMVKAGKIKPSGLGPNNTMLFRADRLESLREIVTTERTKGGNVL